MLRNNSRIWLLITAAAALCGGVTMLSCGHVSNSDGSGGNVSYGEDIHGTYYVLITTTYNSCPDGQAASEKQLLTIEQTPNFASADVYIQGIGAGSEKSKLFTGDVYGTLVILDSVQKTPMGGSCMQLEIQDYSLTIDLNNNDAQGTLIDNIVYVGDSCSPSTVTCRTERTITTTTPGDDDNDDDSSPSADDDDSATPV